MEGNEQRKKKRVQKGRGATQGLPKTSLKENMKLDWKENFPPLLCVCVW